VSAISNTKEFYNKQDEKENVVATPEIKLFLLPRKPYKLGGTTTLHYGHLCKTPCGLQSPLINTSCWLPNLYHTQNGTQCGRVYKS
jgi:hypothetical protein